MSSSLMRRIKRSKKIRDKIKKVNELEAKINELNSMRDQLVEKFTGDVEKFQGSLEKLPEYLKPSNEYIDRLRAMVDERRNSKNNDDPAESDNLQSIPNHSLDDLNNEIDEVRRMMFDANQRESELSSVFELFDMVKDSLNKEHELKKNDNPNWTVESERANKLIESIIKLITNK